MGMSPIGTMHLNIDDAIYLVVVFKWDSHPSGALNCLDLDAIEEASGVLNVVEEDKHVCMSDLLQ
jgi:hypothetical protein